jgi:hypothetical protein
VKYNLADELVKRIICGERPLDGPPDSAAAPASNAARVDRPDAASTSAPHVSDRGCTDGDASSSSVQNCRLARDVSQQVADANRSPKAARWAPNDAAPSSSSRPDDVEPLIQGLKSRLPTPVWPQAPQDQLEDWWLALDSYTALERDGQGKRTQRKMRRKKTEN